MCDEFFVDKSWCNFQQTIMNEWKTMIPLMLVQVQCILTRLVIRNMEFQLKLPKYNEPGPDVIARFIYMQYWHWAYEQELRHEISDSMNLVLIVHCSVHAVQKNWSSNFWVVGRRSPSLRIWDLECLKYGTFVMCIPSLKILKHDYRNTIRINIIKY